LGLAKGRPLSVRMASGKPRSQDRLEGGDDRILAGGLLGFDEQQEARGVIGDGERRGLKSGGGGVP
jgi:hypothetical protein